MADPTRNGNGKHKAVGAADRHLANRAINRSDLSSGAKSILLAIADKAGHGCSTCTAKYDTLVKMTNRSRSQVIRHVQALARSDWITIERRRCPLRGDLSNQIVMGPKFAAAVDQQARLEQEEREKKRPNLGQVLDRGSIYALPGVASTRPRESHLCDPNDSVLTTPLNAVPVRELETERNSRGRDGSPEGKKDLSNGTGTGTEKPEEGNPCPRCDTKTDIIGISPAVHQRNQLAVQCLRNCLDAKLLAVGDGLQIGHGRGIAERSARNRWNS